MSELTVRDLLQYLLEHDRLDLASPVAIRAHDGQPVVASAVGVVKFDGTRTLLVAEDPWHHNVEVT